MEFRTDFWDYVEYNYLTNEEVIRGEKLKGNNMFKQTNMSCENESEAISNFCFWLNNGGLADGYYAVKCLNQIDIYKYRVKVDKSDSGYYQPERVNRFFDFEFYNLELRYKENFCPAFKSLNISDISNTSKKILGLIK